MTRILIVDDQMMIRIGLRAILDSQDDLTVVGEAADGQVAVDQTRALRPDLVLLDVRMPVMDGLQAARQILNPPILTSVSDSPHGPRPRVLMLTTFDLDDYVFEALRAGASGFLLKDSTPDELLYAVRVIAGGDSVLAPGITRRLIEQFVATTPGPSISSRLDAALDKLTDREREVLRLLVLGLSNSEIARQLFIAEQTTKTHVSRILGKLDLRDRVQAVVLGYETGLVRPGEPL